MDFLKYFAANIISGAIILALAAFLMHIEVQHFKDDMTVKLDNTTSIFTTEVDKAVDAIKHINPFAKK